MSNGGRSNQQAKGKHRRSSVRSALKPLSSKPPTYLIPSLGAPTPDLPATRLLPETPSRGARRAAVAAGTLAIAVALTVDAGLATGILSGTARAATAQPATGTGSGTATNYVLQSGSGNCSYPSPPPNGLFAALSPSEYANGAACGEYVTVNGPNGSVQAEVTDQCPECGYGHIDLSQGAFSKIAPLPEGEVNVSYNVDTNPPLTAPLSVTVKDGSSANWLALLPENTGNAVSSVQVQNASGSGWIGMQQSGYGYWIAQGGAGNGPFNVQVTDTAGHQVTLNNIQLSPGQTQNTGTWMYGH